MEWREYSNLSAVHDGGHWGKLWGKPRGKLTSSTSAPSLLYILETIGITAVELLAVMGVILSAYKPRVVRLRRRQTFAQTPQID